MSDPVGIAALGLSGFAALAAITAHVRFRRLRRACALLTADAGGSSFIVAVSRQTAELERLRTEVGGLHAEFDRFRDAVDESIRRVAVLRYDAFGEMGGRLSWSVALLDHHGDGLVLTALVGRAETRCYVKSLRRGIPDTRLSPEEISVVDAAMRPARPAARAVVRPAENGAGSRVPAPASPRVAPAR